jgi:NAD(P)-dependent dehydrogenase (short-subunit alcohol dehydrogenase family)
MFALAGKSMAVVGGSRGVGREVVSAGIASGLLTLAIARNGGALEAVHRELPGVETLQLDACDEATPGKVFDVRLPDVLVITAGAFPPTKPLYEQNWGEFAINWYADVKLAFLFCREALRRPLPSGSRVIIVSSAAALSGSPISGGYAGAKRTQIFIANYAQKESDRLGLGLSFAAIVPRIMPDTELGRHAVAGYSSYLGVSPEDFLKGMPAPPAARQLADAIIGLARQTEHIGGKVFSMSGNGLEVTAA